MQQPQPARAPQPAIFRPPYVQGYFVPQGYGAPSGNADFSKAIKDVSIVAVFVVIAIILIVVFSVYLIVRFLRAVVDESGKIAPTVECAAWLEARRLSYVTGHPPPTNPATGKPYTNCEASSQAVADTQTVSGAPCPQRTMPPPATQQSPYIYYMAAQQC